MLRLSDWLLHETADNVGRTWYWNRYLGGLETYRRICDLVVEDGYDGFELSPPADASVAGE